MHYELIKYLNISLFPFFQNLLFALSVSMFVFLGVLYWDKKVKASNVFMLMGNSSYSLYLLHNPMQSVLVRFSPKSELQYVIFLEFSLVVIVIAILSYVYHLIFEKKVIALIKNKADRYVA